jgi:triosephosphate isomerase
MTSQRTPVIIGNWKMNLTLDEARDLARTTAAVADAVAPQVRTGIAAPFPYIITIAEAEGESALLVGAQDVSRHEAGAHTGDVAASMLAPWCDFAIVGHSERRQHHGESDEVVRAKAEVLLAAGMIALVCVGETAAERDAGDAGSVVTRQIAAATAGRTGSDAVRLMIAYEPVWAIGTGVSARPEDAQAMARTIRDALRMADAALADHVPILYGGSVTAANSADYLRQPDIDGALVGGASLKAGEFAAIVQGATTGA